MSRWRRADGRLRPTNQRRRARQRRARDLTPERQEWLALFESGARDEFFRQVVFSECVFLAAFAETTGLERGEAARLLGETADDRGWLKLCTADGLVVGAGPGRPPRRERTEVDPELLVRFKRVTRNREWNNRGYREALGIRSFEEMSVHLEAVAEERRWRKLRLPDGLVLAIGEPVPNRTSPDETAAFPRGIVVSPEPPDAAGV